MRTPAVSRWKSNKNITRCHGRLGSVQFQLQLESVRYKVPEWGPAVDRGLWALSDSRLSSPAKMRKKCCYGQKNLVSICSSLSPSPTHLSHTTSINPLDNKEWEVSFYEEVCSFVLWSSSLLLTMFPHIFIYMYMYTYSCIVAIQQPVYYYFYYHYCSLVMIMMMMMMMI